MQMAQCWPVRPKSEGPLALPEMCRQRRLSPFCRMAHIWSGAAAPAMHCRRMRAAGDRQRQHRACGTHGRQAAARARADTYTQSDVLSVEQSIVGHVEYTLARSRYKFDDQEAYQATSLSLRDRLIESWNDTQQYFKCARAEPARPACPWRAERASDA